MSKFSYTVRGSEDGLLAVTTSAKKAVEIAAHYIKSGGDPENGIEHRPVYAAQDRLTYDLGFAARDLKTKWGIVVESVVRGVAAGHGLTTVEIERFTTNYYHGTD